MTNIVVVRKEIITAVLKDTEYSAVFSEALKQNDGKLMIEILKKYCVEKKIKVAELNWQAQLCCCVYISFFFWWMNMAYVENQPRRRPGFRSKKKPPSGRLARITFVKNPQTANSMEQDLQQPAKAPVFLSLRYPGKDWVALNSSRDPTPEELANLASQGKPLEIQITDPVTQQQKTYKIVKKNDRETIEAAASQQNEQDPRLAPQS